VWYARPNICVTRVEGHNSTTLASAFMRAVDRASIPPGAFGIHDWTAMTGFDALVAPRLMAWTLDLRPRPKRVVIATTAPLIAMAIRAANLTLKSVELVRDQGALGEAIDAAIRAMDS
jgi:hypothetical protein